MLPWEAWRRGGAWCAVALCGVCSMAAILYGSILRAGPFDPVEARSLHIFFLWTQFVCFGGAAYAAQGSPTRLYLRPISTRMLVGWTMLLGMVATTAMSLFAGALINWQFGFGEPVVAPALFMAAALVALQGTYWGSTNTGLIQPIASATVAVLLKQWLDARSGGGPLAHTTNRWNTVTLPDVVAFAGVALSAYLVAVLGLARDRRGERESRRGWLALLFRRPYASVTVARNTMRPFRSAAAAQFWFEWRQSGHVLPLICVVFLVFLLVSYFARWFDNRDYELLHISIGAAIGIIPICAIAGLVIAHRNSNRGGVECSGFLATLPMSSSGMSSALLKMAAVSLFLTSGMLAVVLALTSARLYAAQGAVPVIDLWSHHGDLSALLNKVGYGWGPLAVGLFSVGAWGTLTLGVSLVLTGRQPLVNGGLVGGLAALISYLAFSEALAPESSKMFREVTSSCFGLASFAGTIWLYVIAWKRRFISSRAVLAASAAWVGLALLICSVRLAVGPAPALFFVFAMGISALPVASVAAAPLALNWNRHR